MITLNIGLHTPVGHEDLTAARVLLVLRAYGVNVTAWAVHQSDTEPTLVVETTGLTRRDVHSLAVRFHQDAIATFDGDKGLLIGPKAAEWGEFDPTQFILLDGSRLAASPTQGELAASTERPGDLTASYVRTNKARAVQDALAQHEIKYDVQVPRRGS